jgi:hypothetical protein
LRQLKLNINPGDYGILDSEYTILHLIEGEFLYCDLAIEGKLLVTENQLDQILGIENILIHKIFNSIQYIHSLSPAGRSKFKQSKKQVDYLSIENFQDDLHDDVLIFRLNS